MKNKKDELIKDTKRQLDELAAKLIKEFYPLSNLKEDIDTGNRINYVVNTISLAREILRDIPTEKE